VLPSPAASAPPSLSPWPSNTTPTVEAATVAPAASIERAEMMLREFEALALTLGGRDRSDLSGEPNRLTETFERIDSAAVAAVTPHRTGSNRDAARIEREMIAAGLTPDAWLS
jgi:hypothetical protein